ncbi:MAG TPA: hypothetical protein VGN12_21980 [Pirellulales bacterium]
MSTDSPELPSLGSTATSSPESLAHRGREKSLRQARSLLIIIGLLMVVVYAVTTIRMPEEVRQEAIKLQEQGQLITRQAREAIVRINQVIACAFVALGVIFVVLGLALRSYPVPIAITAFVLYLAAVVVTGLIDPTTFARGLLVKLIVAATLVKAILAAVAYRRALHASTIAEPV